MIHLAKDKVVISDLVILYEGEACISVEEDCGSIDISLTTFLGKVLRKMALAKRPTFLQKFRLACKYLFI